MNIEDLISQYIDGDLPSDAEAEMHHRLAVSPEARKLFRAQIALRGIARNPKVLHAPPQELRARLFDRLEREEGMKPQAPLPSPPPAYAAEMAPPVPSPTSRGETRRRRRAIAWLLPTAVASIIAVAILWKPGEPLVRPDSPALADGSVGSSTGGAAVQPPSGGATGPSADVPVQEAPAQEAPARAVSKDVAATQPAISASGRRVAPMSAHAASPRKAFGGESLAFAPKGAVDTVLGGAIRDGVEGYEDPHTIAMADNDGMGKSPVSSESESDPAARSLMLGRSPSEYGKKFPEPDVHTMEGRGEKLKRHDDGGNGGGPTADKPDGADSHAGTMAAPPNVLAEGLMGNGAHSLPMDMDTVGIRASARSFSTSRPDEVGDAAELGLSAPRFVIALHQGSFVSTAGGGIDLDMGVRGGMQFDRGRQLVFALIGLGSYHRTVSDSVTRLVANGVVSYPPASPQTFRERSYEVAGGLGYRYTVRLSTSWGVGAGGWSTVSAHYLRAGIETPVTYLPARWLRLEIAPSVRYSGTHGGSALTGESRVLPSGDEETIRRVTTPDGDGAVDIGIGFGASVMW